MPSKAFRGEIWTNIDSRVLEAIAKANTEEISGCVGGDRYSRHAIELVQAYFKEPIHAAYTINGTGANILALKAMLDRWGCVICAADTHIHTNEAGATEYAVGAKILCAESSTGKLTPQSVEKCIRDNKKHRPQVVVLTQPTELGVLYTVEELKALCDCAHANGLYVYVDGARLGHALMALDTNLTQMIEETDVDAFTIGGTKAGAMFGEMVIFRREQFARELAYLQKQTLQHFDKSTFLGVQFDCLLENGIWLENARKSNENAKILEKLFREKGVEIHYPVQTNMVFAVIPPQTLAKLTQVYDLHYWDTDKQLVRFAVTANTAREDMERLAQML